jgi:hypothetical protein
MISFGRNMRGPEYSTILIPPGEKGVTDYAFDVISGLEEAGIIKSRSKDETVPVNVVIDEKMYRNVYLIYDRSAQDVLPFSLTLKKGDSADPLELTIFSLHPLLREAKLTGVEIKFVDGDGREVYTIKPFRERIS